MLIEALSFEEITTTSCLESFLREMRDSEIDELTRTEIEEKIRHMLVDTIKHSRMLTEMVKGVMKSEQNEF